MCVRTKRSKGNLAGVQVIDHGLEAAASRSGINIRQQWVLRTLQLQCHGRWQPSPSVLDRLFVCGEIISRKG